VCVCVCVHTPFFIGVHAAYVYAGVYPQIFCRAKNTDMFF